MPGGQALQQRPAVVQHGGGHAQVVQVLHQALQARGVARGPGRRQVVAQRLDQARQAASEIAVAKALERQPQGARQAVVAQHHIAVGGLELADLGVPLCALGRRADGVDVGPDARAVLHLQIVQRLAQGIQDLGLRPLALALLQRILQRHELLRRLAEGLPGLGGGVALAGQHALCKLHQFLRPPLGLRGVHVGHDGLGAHHLHGARGFLPALGRVLGLGLLRVVQADFLGRVGQHRIGIVHLHLLAAEMANGALPALRSTLVQGGVEGGRGGVESIYSGHGWIRCGTQVSLGNATDGLVPWAGQQKFCGARGTGPTGLLLTRCRGRQPPASPPQNPKGVLTCQDKTIKTTSWPAPRR